LSPRVCISLGAALAALAVGLGAFGAHGLKQQLPLWYPEANRAAEMLTSWETGVRYQMYAALGIVLVGLWSAQQKGRRPLWSAMNLFAGTILFSGMLYGWVLTESKPLVRIVPLGGLAMVTGWLIFAVQAFLDREPAK
jgi:uncharacterized membrane protein YgdD (TMEM256/DUF423 family)